VEELKSNAGSQFDTGVVEAFLGILARDGAQPLTWKASAATDRASAGARRQVEPRREVA